MKTKLLLGFTFLAFQFSFAKMLTVVDPVAPSLADLTYCDFNNDGFGEFDLTMQNTTILAAQSGAPSNYNVTYHETSLDAEFGSNPIVSPYYNISPVSQTVYYRVRNVSTNDYAVGSFQLVVNPSPNLTAPAPYTICDADQDGAAFFDLTTLIPGLLNGGSYSLTFHETITDAETNGNTIPSPSSFMNIMPFSQTIYVRGGDNSTGCASVLPIELQVNPSPIVGSVPSITVCDADANPLNGVTSVDLTQQTAVILALQPLAASNYTVTYYTTILSADNGTAPIITTTNYMGSNGESIWYRVEDNSSYCFNVGSFQLVIDEPFDLVTPLPIQACDSDANPNNQFTTFDLTVRDSQIVQQNPGYSVTYFPSLSNAYAGTNPIATPTAYINSISAVQTLGVKVTSPSGCVSYTSLDIRVLPIPMPNTNPPVLAPKCDVNNPGDMMEYFDLTVNAAYIANGNPNVALHYFRTIIDAQYNQNELLPTAALVGSNVWVRVENTGIDYQGNHCYALVQQPLTVYPSPNPVLISNNTLNTVYVDGSNNVVQDLTLDAQLNGNYTFQWEVDGASIPDAISSVYTVNTASPTGANRLFTVTVQGLNTGCTGSDSIIVAQSSGVPSPLGPIIQTFNPGDSLAYLTVAGSNILWYASANGKMTMVTNSTPLPLSTLLVNDTTYYASQTIGGSESAARLPVTVHALLGLPDNGLASLQFAPNPVKDNLTLQSSLVLKTVSIYTMLGQKVVEQNYNDMDVTINLSRLTIGNYILKAQSETGQKTIRIVKE